MPTGFVYVQNGRLMLDGQILRHIGVNIPGLPYYGTPALPYSQAGHQAINLSSFREMGAKVVRIFGANNQMSITDAVDRVEALANLALSAYNMRLLVSLTDIFCNWHQAPGDDAYCAPSPSGYSILSHAWYSGGFRVNYLPWVRALVTRLRNNPAVLAWELGNELKDENAPSQLVAFTSEVVGNIRQIDADHLISTGSTGGFALLDPNSTSQWYQMVDVVQEHTYDGARSAANVNLAHALGRAHIVGEAGFAAGCGSGGRAGLVQTDVDQWFNVLGSDGYYPWKAQAQPNDIGDGDNIYGMDPYCHTDFGELYVVLRSFAGPPLPPPVGTVPLAWILLGGVGVVIAGYLIGTLLSEHGLTLPQVPIAVLEIPEGQPIPPGYRIVG